MAARIKKGDQVVVLAGKYRGRAGRVLRVYPKKDRIVVEGINMIKRHTRPTQRHPKGGIVEKEAPIHISNVKRQS
jgi:large subunit ribosomal protein L24